ncbi:uncharacterized protein BX663DRAFT_514034 [Cokeromyces recurvatus]|uniref:uncharacterized protein n=1 Tax=Cokeromyces recurvatus TaxID=90255 RepID=UPI00221EC7BF|nr:uncharacterized protein BX663DRAFT_514034 [Cokeromyces recurvatus]KAI7901294.1 hypothetical protein BX663DRAFT_514034 [Cokeromyces recurvatus]
MTSRYRERKYNTSDNDRLLRALSQPVQAWDKKWTQHSNSKNLQTFKWMKSDRVIEFEEDEDEIERESMEVEQTPAKDIIIDTEVKDEQIATNKTTSETSSTPDKTNETNAKHENVGDKQPDSLSSNLLKDTIPGGPSSLILTNKVVSSVQQQDDDDDDEQRSQTPNLDDISDVEDPNANNDDSNDVDSVNDPSKHPALAPHAQPHLTDDDMTDSAAATPQTTTDSNTPMTILGDDTMPETNNNNNQHIQTGPHPLSQEILTGATAFINNADVNPLNNTLTDVQAPEDNVTTHQPLETMEE